MATSEPKVNETLPTNLVKTKTTKTTEKSTMLNLQQEKKGTQMIRSRMALSCEFQFCRMMYKTK